MTNTIANAFGSTFAFLQTHKAQQKMQKSYQATAQGQCKLDTVVLRPKRATSANNQGFVVYEVQAMKPMLHETFGSFFILWRKR